MKKIISLILVFTFAVSLCSCTPTEHHTSLNAMDTFMEFTVYGGQPEWAAESVEDTIKELDRLLSTTDTGDVGLLNKNGSARFGALSLEALSRSVELCGELGGALDITVYPLVEEWGFISGRYKIPSESEIKKLLPYVGYKKVEINGDTVSLPKNTRIDLGATAKGWKQSGRKAQNRRFSNSAEQSRSTAKNPAAPTGRSRLPTPTIRPNTSAISAARTPS